MPERLPPSSGLHFPLTTSFQGLTEFLAASTTQAQVFEVFLTSVVPALGAVSGTVLLVDGTRLNVVAAWQKVPEDRTIWQDGPLDAPVPAADVLRSGQALFYEHAGALLNAYPEIELITGGRVFVASAVLPMFRDGRPLGSLVLDFREPHAFSAEERDVLRLMAAHCGMALGRVQHLETARQTPGDSFDAFVAFAERALLATDIGVLAQDAVQVLQATLGDVSVGYFVPDNGAWTPRVLSNSLSPQGVEELESALLTGIPEDELTMGSQGAVFLPSWDTGQSMNSASGVHHVRAFYPCLVADVPVGLLALGREETAPWTAREQAVFRTVGSNLNAALERTEAARRLQHQRMELSALSWALEGFAKMTLDLTQEIDPRSLIRRAQDVVLSVLPDSCALYYEQGGDRWKNTVQTGTVRHAALQALIDAGPRVGQTPSIDGPWTTRTALYLDESTGSSDAALLQHVEAAATLPVLMYGEPVGVFVACRFHASAWTGTEKTVLETVVRSLGIAMERARDVAQLNHERAALDAFARFTHSVGTETDLMTLAQQATVALRARFPEASVGYYEPDGELWKARTWTDDVPDELVARLTAGLPAETPMIAEVLRAQRTVFTEAWHAVHRQIEHTEEYTAVANSPLIVNGTVRGVLSVGVKHTDAWHERDQAVIQAIEAGLNLALDRAEQARLFEEEREALVAFMTFTERVGDESNVWALVRHAAKLLQETRAVDVIYLERGPEAFTAQVWSESVPSDVLQNAQHGYPLDQPNLARAERERQLVFEDDWSADEQLVPESVMYRAAAFQPFFQGEVMSSVLVMVSRQAQHWSERDQGIFRAVGRSLDLALKRAEQTQTLALQTQLLKVQHDQLATHSQELSVANEELSAFAHSASHDLRTPVRHVTAFTGLARKALATTPNVQASQYLDRVQHAAERMTALIDAMLILSNAVSTEPRSQQVDLNGLVQQAQRDVQLEYPHQVVSWRLQPLPSLLGDPDMLQQVVTNFISNAVKYSKTREVTQIGVWAEEREDEWAIFVQDNGVGFNPKYQTRLFGVFQRLHSQKDFEGTGVGLATVRRIVLKHGGQVFAEGHVDEGATFGFTLPKRDLSQL
ncbi:GAF domain-containing protein (plasmid) [Deinococcus radiomollis]|uniref:GAF domain-containing protein n=1 Tax=Deinococcus radiomollis TaxID=468916 RepID=UPI0038918249